VLMLPTILTDVETLPSFACTEVAELRQNGRRGFRRPSNTTSLVSECVAT